MVMNITKYILDIPLICILKFFLKISFAILRTNSERRKHKRWKKILFYFLLILFLNLSKNLNKKFFKNLFRCSENKQRKEKTQTMKKNFILLFIIIFKLFWWWDYLSICPFNSHLFKCHLNSSCSWQNSIILNIFN